MSSPCIVYGMTIILGRAVGNEVTCDSMLCAHVQQKAHSPNNIIAILFRLIF